MLDNKNKSSTGTGVYNRGLLNRQIQYTAYILAYVNKLQNATNKYTNQLVFTAPFRPQFRTPPVRNAPELRSLHAAAPPVQSEYPAERRAAAAVPLPESP